MRNGNGIVIIFSEISDYLNHDSALSYFFASKSKRLEIVVVQIVNDGLITAEKRKQTTSRHP